MRDIRGDGTKFTRVLKTIKFSIRKKIDFKKNLAYLGEVSRKYRKVSINDFS